MKKRGFTLIELIAVLVILAILALIVTPLVMSIIRKAKISADKRSVDAYGRSVELAIASYLMDTGTFPTDISQLTIEYTGKEVVCNVMQMKANGGIYLSECSVGGKQVKDDSTEDGYYHYGTRDITNEEYVDMYGKSLEKASKDYLNENGTLVGSIQDLNIDYVGKNVSCGIKKMYFDGSIYLEKCNVDGDNNSYEYGIYMSDSVNSLLAIANKKNVTSYSSGNISEMYTFEHSETEQTTALIDYRYIGANPNNYVTFNNEMWRIIGVFTVEDENGNKEMRIKIVRNVKLDSNMAWNNAPFTNEWSNASLQEYLNGDYYESLSSDAKNMIADAKYYLGGVSTNSISATACYDSERGTTVYSGRSTSWFGKIALMYPSDYLYNYALGIDDTCFNNGFNCRTDAGGDPTKSWIYNTNSDDYQWLLSPDPAGAANSFDCFKNGIVYSNGDSTSDGIRPSLYLASNINISSGNGTEQNPYKLSL